jgi:hypothetical protein
MAHKSRPFGRICIQDLRHWDSVSFACMMCYLHIEKCRIVSFFYGLHPNAFITKVAKSAETACDLGSK